MALSEISSQQSAPTENTMKWVNQFLDYMWTHPDAIIQYHASDMILNIHSDSFTSLHPKHAAVPVVTSSLEVYHPMETRLNLTGQFMSHAPSSRWLLHPQQKGALFLNAQEAKVFRLVLAK